VDSSFARLDFWLIWLICCPGSGVPVDQEEDALFAAFLDANDFSPNSRRTFTQEVRKSALWFIAANRERFVIGRVRHKNL
jgi:hypothetical protein